MTQEISVKPAPLSLCYVIGPYKDAMMKGPTPVRLKRQVKNGETEVSIVAPGGKSLGIYGIIPRLLSEDEARLFHAARAVVERRATTVSPRGKTLVSSCFQLPQDVARILNEARYVEP